MRNYEGLKIAFELAAQGKSDREVAMALNTLGYRTTGTHGSRPFSKDKSGIVFGDGGTALVLEDLNHAQKRGAEIYGEY